MLPIRQNLNQLTGINRTYKAVLIEVCELVENGKQGKCSAQNEYFAERLSASLRTISRTITGLEEAGLLTSSGATNKRVLLPSAGLRACYAGTDTTAAIQALSSALLDARSEEPTIDKTIAKTIDTPAKMAIAKPDPTIDNRGTTIANRGSNYSQTGSRVYRDDQYEQNEEEVALRSALVAAQKKIGELTAQLEERTRERNALRNSLAAVRPASSVASASHTRGGAATDPHKVPLAESKHITPEGFARIAEALGYQAAYFPHYRGQMLLKAGAEQRDEKGWQNFIQRYLTNDANSETGLITTPPNDSATTHASRSTFSQQPQRPANGAKPTSAGSEFAGALAERRARLRSAGPGHHGPAMGSDAS
ncbi:helix-turn-helix domain-containing protein [Hymenobacter metallilatus]|nr:helix-turn-helix domain-containing protein [Hymenobacter metallilatus]